MTLCLEMKQIAESICLISQKWEREIQFDSEDAQLKIIIESNNDIDHDE